MLRQVTLGSDSRKIAVFTGGGPRNMTRARVNDLPERIDGYVRARLIEDFDGLPGRQGGIYKYEER